MSFERRQPSVDLRAFLDPLKPGEYFDCGRARLYGIDEALEAEALRRGRAVGDDDFQLVATNGGLIFCRASIMFAIAARWKDLTISRPDDGNRRGEVLLPISWPTHGDLQFTVSRRLGSNIFRRWLQLQAQATRRSQVEQDVRFERAAASPAAEANGHSHSDSHPGSNGHAEIDSSTDHRPERNGLPLQEETDTTDHGEAAELRTLVESDRQAIEYATEQEGRRRPPDASEVETAGDDGRVPVVDPLATLDAAVVDEWVDDRVPHASNRQATDSPPARRPVSPPSGSIDSALFEGDVTADPFNGHDLPDEKRRVVLQEQEGQRDAVRFEVRPVTHAPASSPEPSGRDATATHLMRRTVDGTEIFVDGGVDDDTEGFSRPPGRLERRVRERSTSGGRSGERQVGVPVPEISGARLQVAEPPNSVTGPRLDIRSTLLAGQRESEWVEMLRRRKVHILGLVTIVALGLIALIGFLSGDGDDGNETAADVPLTAETGAGASVTAAADGQASDEGVVGSSTTMAVLTGAAAENATIDSTAPTLRVSSTSVQICHSNYGGCVPVAADVDCEGDGDGPAFQATPVAVFGDDVYELDTDDDREACEADQPRLGAAGGGG